MHLLHRVLRQGAFLALLAKFSGAVFYFIITVKGTV